MEQHAVPQNISSYEFRLVGDMTLKQFFQLAGGIILGVIVFRLPIPVFIKYPLVFVFVMAGILMAFVPIMGRPFTAWIMAFFRAIYSPTEFVWAPDTEVPITAVAMPKTVVIPTETNPPSLVKAAPTVVAPITTPVAPPVDVPMPKPTVPNIPPPSSTKETSFSTLTQVPKIVPENHPPTPPAPKPIAASPITPPIQKPVSQAPVVVGPVSQPLKNPVQTIVSPKPTINVPTLATNIVPTPTTPNVLAGMVTDRSGAGIDAAIVEIIDALTQVPARALRTNKTGMFQIVTPLKTGSYDIHAEKEGLNFAPVSVLANDKIIPPVIIKSS